MTAAAKPPTRLVVGPFNRVEGDLEVQLEIAGGQVQSARVNAPMYRGFEQILLQKPALDALIYVPRICGICSVSQSVAAARALADAMGLSPAAMPPNGLLVTNLMQATENMADHLTHFYLFFMPDFARPAYAGLPWHDAVQQRFAAQQGRHARLALAARQRWFTLLGTLGGKWPHTQAIQPAGSSRAVEPAERIRLLAKVREFRAFLEQTLFGAPLESIAAIDSEAALRTWHAAAASDSSDLRLFLTLAWQLGLDRMGAGPGLYMANGSYPQASADGAPLFARGVWDAVETPASASAPATKPLDVAAISEDATRAWLEHRGGPRHPADGLTLPVPDKQDAYTWNKAPRLAGRVLETGALARQLVHGTPLLRDVAARCGATVYSRVLARLFELALVVPAMEQWLRELRPDRPYFISRPLPDDAQGVGLTEAARGSLGHWISIRDGKLANYQIIAPTSWNFSPRDAGGVPGALEAALVGAPVLPGETSPLAVQHIVRSFDPCMVCTVH